MKRKILMAVLLGVMLPAFIITAAAIEDNTTFIFAGIGFAISAIVAYVVEIIFNKYEELKNTIIFAILTGIVFPAIITVLGVVAANNCIIMTGIAMSIMSIIVYITEIINQKF